MTRMAGIRMHFSSELHLRGLRTCKEIATGRIVQSEPSKTDFRKSSLLGKGISDRQKTVGEVMTRLGK